MRLLIPKRFLSTIDFLSDARFSSERLIPNPFEETGDNLYDNDLWNHLRQRLSGGDSTNDTFVQATGRSFSLVENGWFMMDGISFSLEICVDFLQGFAKSSFALLSASRGNIMIPSAGGGRIEQVKVPSYMAQLSIVTGAGLNVRSGESLTLTNGGSIFVLDGLKPHDPQLRTCAVSKFVDGSLGYRHCEGSKPPNIHFESFDLYSSSEETKRALEGLYSLAKGNVPQIHVFKTQPIVQVQPLSLATSVECSQS